MTTDEKAVEIIYELLKYDASAARASAHEIIEALRAAGIELFEAAPSPRQETSQ